MRFGEKIRYLMNSNGLTEEDLSNHLRVNKDVIENILKLDIPRGIDVEIIIKIADKFGIGTEYLLYEEDDSDAEQHIDYKYLAPECILTKDDIFQVISELKAILLRSTLSNDYKKMYGKALQIVLEL